MKSPFLQYPNDNGAMKLLSIKTTNYFRQKWTTVRWQNCPLCGLIFPD
jgi:hypothetical protein